jgi:biopolymer transport protein ExbD
MAGVGLRRSRGVGRGDDLPLSADINVTSLVDVAFTLLVIFIITAPILQGGLEVNLPQADIRPLTSLEDYVVASVRPDGSVYLEETGLSIEEFETSFAQLAEPRAADPGRRGSAVRHRLPGGGDRAAGGGQPAADGRAQARGPRPLTRTILLGTGG